MLLRIREKSTMNESIVLSKQHFLIKYMVADYQSVTAVVSTEVCQITHIGYTGKRLLGSQDDSGSCGRWIASGQGVA